MAIFAARVNERPLPGRTAIAILASVRWSRVNSKASRLAVRYAKGGAGFALAPERYPWAPKHLAGAIPTFS
jgi:hypothetical protein